MHLFDQIKEKAKRYHQIIVLPESYDERILYAAETITHEKLAKIVILGDPAKIQAKADEQGINLGGVELINPVTSPNLDQYISNFVELRKRRGKTIVYTEARELLTATDNLYFAGMMEHSGDAGGQVAGAANTTGNVLKAGIQTVGLASGIKTVSSFFLMITKSHFFGENGIILFADCAVNPNPNAQALAEIAIATAGNCKVFLDVEALVALLSFSSKGSATHPDADKVTKALEIARQMKPDLQIDGELQADAALLPSVGGKKAQGSPVAGKANVLIFPNLDAGNIGYKLVECVGEAEAVGPIIQGLAKPVNYLSRGCSVDAIVNLTAITTVQASQS